MFWISVKVGRVQTLSVIFLWLPWLWIINGFATVFYLCEVSYASKWLPLRGTRNLRLAPVLTPYLHWSTRFTLSSGFTTAFLPEIVSMTSGYGVSIFHVVFWWNVIELRSLVNKRSKIYYVLSRIVTQLWILYHSGYNSAVIAYAMWCVLYWVVVLTEVAAAVYKDTGW